MKLVSSFTVIAVALLGHLKVGLGHGGLPTITERRLPPGLRRRQPGPARRVAVVADTLVKSPYDDILNPNGLHPAQFTIVFGATAQDGAMVVEMATPLVGRRRARLAISVTDYTSMRQPEFGPLEWPAPPGIVRKSGVLKSTTTLRNEQIFDPRLSSAQEGRPLSLLESLWIDNVVAQLEHRAGAAIFGDSIELVRSVAKHAGLDLDFASEAGGPPDNTPPDTPAGQLRAKIGDKTILRLMGETHSWAISQRTAWRPWELGSNKEIDTLFYQAPHPRVSSVRGQPAPQPYQALFALIATNTRVQTYKALKVVTKRWKGGLMGDPLLSPAWISAKAPDSSNYLSRDPRLTSDVVDSAAKDTLGPMCASDEDTPIVGEAKVCRPVTPAWISWSSDDDDDDDDDNEPVDQAFFEAG